MRLTRKFFAQPTLKAAQKRLGQRIVFGKQSGIITETEAYIGEDDPACHACRGITPRTRVMFGPPGHSYIYLIYGMYHCLNFVTEQEGFPAAVLIRGIIGDDGVHYDGPGKLCRYFGLTKEQNGIDLVTDKNFYIEKTNQTPKFESTPRIGIRVGTDKLWRFVAKS